MLGSTIKQLRKQSGLTQTKFAEELNKKYNLNIERSMISKWETGSQTPMVYTISCIADFFGVSIDFITGEQKQPPEMDGKINKLIQIMQNLTDEELDKLLDYAQLLTLRRDQ